MEDLREDAARYYDVTASFSDDIDFYKGLIAPGHSTRLLELGCGTGRVFIELLPLCASAVGVDVSQGMLNVCRKKLEKSRAYGKRAILIHSDICAVELHQQFDLITAPFRVFQNLETDTDVKDLFAVIRACLLPNGKCILNVFNPNASRDEIITKWANANPAEEIQSGEYEMGCGFFRHSYKLQRITETPLVVYPELVYRYFENEELADEVSFVPPMRIYYPDEFRDIIRDHGFEIKREWGGYNGEEYGSGPELVVMFALS